MPHCPRHRDSLCYLDGMCDANGERLSGDMPIGELFTIRAWILGAYASSILRGRPASSPYRPGRSLDAWGGTNYSLPARAQQLCASSLPRTDG